ncbi:MAG TPA: hypothetical protein VH583_20985 [Vicinamibacterales bacterium]
MRTATFDFLRCPYCGGRLELVQSLFHRRDADEIRDGIIACQCCVFPVVDGIPVMHLLPAATTARDQIEAGRPELARRTMFGLDDERQAAIFDDVAASEQATYRETVEAFGPNFEGGYFLYRFSDPTFLVAQAVVQAVGSAVLGGRRAIDICGGSGHLTRTLAGLSSEPPVLADLYFAKIWLARRFTAPRCEPVCCDGNAPMPFARGAFGLATCTDAFMYIWTKRQFVSDMERLVDDGGGTREAGAVVIGHTHNQRTWSPSHGQPLAPEGYAALFEAAEPKLFAEHRLFSGLIEDDVLDLSQVHTKDSLDRDPALTIVGTRHPGVFVRHPVVRPARAIGEFRLNPLYFAEHVGSDVRLRLRFPDSDYEQEYAACRRYLPDEVSVSPALVEALAAGRAAPAELAELVRQRVVLDLPQRYY